MLLVMKAGQCGSGNLRTPTVMDGTNFRMETSAILFIWRTVYLSGEAFVGRVHGVRNPMLTLISISTR